MTTGLPNPRFIPGRKPRARNTRDRGTINTQHPPRDSVQRPRSLNLDRKNASLRDTVRSVIFDESTWSTKSPDRKSATKHTQTLRTTAYICTATTLDTLTVVAPITLILIVSNDDSNDFVYPTANRPPDGYGVYFICFYVNCLRTKPFSARTHVCNSYSSLKIDVHSKNNWT